MYTMNFLVWILPITFMIHDFEEIIMAEIWGKRYRKEIDATWPKRQPFGLNYVRSFQTPSLSIGIDIFFLLFSFVSFFSVFFNYYFVWYSLFSAVVLHFIFIHIRVCIQFRHYVPGIITSVILLPPCIWLLYITKKLLHYGLGTVFIACLLGVVFTLVLMPPLHKAMHNWSRTLDKYSETT